MRILVLANSDIHSCCALNQLLPTLKSDSHKIYLWLSARVGQQATTLAELARLQYFEQTLFTEKVFPALEKSKKPTPYFSFKKLAKIYCENHYRLENEPNSTATLAILKQLAPDLVLSIRYGKILKPAFLNIPKSGTLNLHSGKLPDYPGVMATFRAMLNRDKTIHTTLHSIDDGNIDQGDIVSASNTLLNLKQCYFSNVLSLYNDGVTLMINAVRTINEGRALTTMPQIPSENYYSFPNETELRKFFAQGLSLVDETRVNELIQSHFTAEDHE